MAVEIGGKEAAGVHFCEGLSDIVRAVPDVSTGTNVYQTLWVEEKRLPRSHDICHLEEEIGSETWVYGIEGSGSSIEVEFRELEAPVRAVVWRHNVV